MKFAKGELHLAPAVRVTAVDFTGWAVEILDDTGPVACAYDDSAKHARARAAHLVSLIRAMKALAL